MKKVPVDMESVESMISHVISLIGYRLIEVDFHRGGKNPALRVTIDKPGGVTIDDCKLASKRIGERLDLENPIQNSYLLEVSSPGLNRKLKRIDEFEMFRGREVRLVLRRPPGEGNIRLGIAMGYEGDEVILQVEGELERFPYRDIARARLNG